MNRLQEELLNILEIYLHICHELGLTYYLANGSALGAEKYGGFIPWDDDIDIIMPRDDYKVFCDRASAYLPSHLFLQNYKTDVEFPFFYSKLRNSNTAFIESGVKHFNINHGIYIDIFPVDGYPDGKISQLILQAKLRVYSWMQFCGFENDPNLRKRIFKKLGYHKRTAKTLAHMEKSVSAFGKHTKNLCDYSDRQKKGCLPREVYGKGRIVQFERFQVTIPELTDEYLTYKYGDWRSDLPKEQQRSHHQAEICDLDNSYRKYISH